MDNLTASPSVFINPQVPTPSNGKKLNPRIAFVVLGLFVLVVVVLGVKVLLGRSATSTVPSTAPVNVVSKAPSEVGKDSPSGTIALQLSKTDVKVGENVLVVIKLNTGGRPTSGTDVVIKYNPTALEATDSAIIKGTIYPDYPLTKVYSDLKTIRISGLSSSASTDFNGEGILATINFKAKLAGKTALILDFTPGATADSNILETVGGTEWLKEVNNLEITIK